MPARIGLYGNFGAGNLGNECTLHAVIERILEHHSDAQLLCFCADPDDVRSRHGIPACRSGVGKAGDGGGSLRRRGGFSRLIRIVFRRAPLEIAHWVKTLLSVRRVDTLIVAGTGIIADYMCGPTGWPYEIFRLSVLAAICRVKLVFLSVGVGPIRHPLSRWFLKRSFELAAFRSYRDEASRLYMESIGFSTHRDHVYPDVVFGLDRRNWTARGDDSADQESSGARKVVGLGLKDYGLAERIETAAFRRYLDLMGDFVAWLHARGYAVRLLIGDIQYDSSVIEEFVTLLKSRSIAAEAPWLMTAPARSVGELLRQLGSTEMVISARYHNLVMALIQDRPMLALSDHAKLDALLTEFGFATFRVSLEGLSVQSLIERFQDLEKNADRLKGQIRRTVENCRWALDEQYAMLFAGAGRDDGPPQTAQ